MAFASFKSKYISDEMALIGVEYITVGKSSFCFLYFVEPYSISEYDEPVLQVKDAKGNKKKIAMAFVGNWYFYASDLEKELELGDVDCVLTTKFGYRYKFTIKGF